MFGLEWLIPLLLVGILATAGSGTSDGDGDKGPALDDGNALDIGVDVGDGDPPPADPDKSEGDPPPADGKKQDKGKDDQIDLATLTPEQIAKLPPDLQQFVKGVQGDYTRKTQELAEKTRALEGRSTSLDVAEQIQETLDTQGPEAAADLLREAAQQLDGKTGTQGRRGAPDGQDGDGGGPLQQIWDEATAIVADPDATPHERKLGTLLQTVLQIQAQSAVEVREAKDSARSGLRQAANREIHQTLTTLYGSDEYKGMADTLEGFAEAVLTTAKREGLESLETAAKLAYHDQIVENARGTAKKRAQDLAEVPDALQARGKVSLGSGEAKDFGDAFRRAKATVAAKYR